MSAHKLLYLSFLDATKTMPAVSQTKVTPTPTPGQVTAAVRLVV